MLRILWRLRNLGDGAAVRKLEKSRARPKTTSIGKCQDAGETRQTADRYQLLFLRQLPARRATLIGALDALPNVIPQARQDRSCQVRQRGLVGVGDVRSRQDPLRNLTGRKELLCRPRGAANDYFARISP